MQKTNIQTFLSLITPSSLSIVLTVFLAACILASQQVPMVRDYLQNTGGLDLPRAFAGFADHILTGVLGESRVSVVVVGAFWAVVGLLVYVFLRALARQIGELDEGISERGFVWPKGLDRTRPLKHQLEITGLRLLALIGLLLVVFLPLARLVRGPVLTEFLGPSEIVIYAGWFVLSLLTWHLIAVLLRLIWLKPRLLG